MQTSADELVRILAGPVFISRIRFLRLSQNFEPHFDDVFENSSFESWRESLPIKSSDDYWQQLAGQLAGQLTERLIQMASSSSKLADTVSPDMQTGTLEGEHSKIGFP